MVNYVYLILGGGDQYLKGYWLFHGRFSGNMFHKYWNNGIECGKPTASTIPKPYHPRFKLSVYMGDLCHLFTHIDELSHENHDLLRRFSVASHF